MTLEGTVEARNDTGIKLDGEWINRSKFRPVPLPDVGAQVRAEVDAKGFLKSLEVLDDPAPAPARPPLNAEHGNPRVAVLLAAATFAAGRPDIKSADVLTIAERWLAWVKET